VTFRLGGDPGRDLFVSPGDPMFYLHHAMIDRTWWMWQMLDPYKRQFTTEAISGTGTFLNQPPSPNTTLDTIVDFDFAASPPLPMRDILSTTNGPFCYIYA
jgi:tyrosinase